MKTIRQIDLAPEWRSLTAAAQEARQRAYAPYSGFGVGAALRMADGRIRTGCNIENASYGLTVCAERVAIWGAVAEGDPTPVALAVASQTGAMPCGACRQVLLEFAPALPVLVVDDVGNAWITSVRELLPASFSQEQLTPAPASAAQIAAGSKSDE